MANCSLVVIWFRQDVSILPRGSIHAGARSCANCGFIEGEIDTGGFDYNKLYHTSGLLQTKRN